MQQPIVAPYPLSDFLEWEVSRQLVLVPKFQRRDVWSLKAKSYLIDTIIRDLPIPPIFIRVRIDPVQRRAVREVVDGQQRLRAVLSFVRNEFPILEVHNSEYGGKYYSDLAEDVRLHLLGYKFSVYPLQDVSDADVLSIFARINTYTVKLNAQELRNASYFGAFKQTVYSLAHQHYAFWRNNNILSDQQITRMLDDELVSELIVSMLQGVGGTKAAVLKDFYRKYDDKFPAGEQIGAEFEQTINLLGNLFGDRLRATQFKREPLFFSLFLAIYDARFGLPNSSQPRLAFTPSESKRIVDRLTKLDTLMLTVPPPEEYVPFITASRLSTADPGKRRLRHDFIWKHVLLGTD